MRLGRDPRTDEKIIQLHSERLNTAEISRQLLARYGIKIRYGNIHKRLKRLGLTPWTQRRPAVARGGPKTKQYLELYALGKSDKEISQIMLLEYQYVYSIRRRLGLPPNKYIRPLYRQVKAMYESGMTCGEIAQRLNRSPKYIGWIRKRMGVPATWKHKNWHPETELRRCYELLNDGYSYGEAAKILTRELGKKVTRSAVAGVAYRRGWKSKNAPSRIKREIEDIGARFSRAETFSDSFKAR